MDLHSDSGRREPQNIEQQNRRNDEVNVEVTSLISKFLRFCGSIFCGSDPVGHLDSARYGYVGARIAIPFNRAGRGYGFSYASFGP